MPHGIDELATAPAPLPSSSALPSPPPPPPPPPPTLELECDPANDTQTPPSAPPADRLSQTSHYILTCARILAACTVTTIPLSFFGWLAIAHIYARVRPTTPVYLERFLQASATGGALLGASLALSVCLFFTARSRWSPCTQRIRHGPGHGSGTQTTDVFPPLHALSSADTLLCASLVLLAVAFSAPVGMALMPGTTTDELGLREAAVLGGLCAIPGGIGLASCACHRAWRLLQVRRNAHARRAEGVREEKVESVVAMAV